MVSPSAICTINSQTLATSGTTGINVAAGSTITIKLANTSGVTSWSINCSMTDGKNPTSTPALINATKTVDPVNFSATFTAPAYSIIDGYIFGAAMQFTSIVNAGQWNQATTTMGVWVLGPNQIRMFFNGETFESDATNGVAPDLNKMVSETPGSATATATVPGSIELTKDLGGVWNAPLVVGLQGNPIQPATLGPLQDGYILTWINGSSQFQVKPPASVLSLGRVYEFENTASDIGTYNAMDGITGVEADLSVAVTSGGGKVLIKAFASALGEPNVTYVPAGQWDFDYWSYVSSTAGSTTLVFDTYIRQAGGTETLLFSATSPAVTSTTVAGGSVTYSYPTDTYINATDRIVVKVSAQTTSGSSITTHFVFDGTTHASHTHTPIPGSAIPLGGDLTGNTGAAVVYGISGATAAFKWLSTATTPSLSQSDLTTNGATGQLLTIHAQNETGTTSTGGGLVLASGTGTTQAGTVTIKTGATNQLLILPTELDLATTASISVFNGGRTDQTASTGTSADYTVDTTGGVKDYVIICKFTSSHLINLPNPATYTGRALVIKVTGSISGTVTCTLHRFGVENIDGVAADYVIQSAWACVRLVTDGTDWYITI